jgi:hypothetical protein
MKNSEVKPIIDMKKITEKVFRSSSGVPKTQGTSGSRR